MGVAKGRTSGKKALAFVTERTNSGMQKGGLAGPKTRM
jgi:hypothetical protein